MIQSFCFITLNAMKIEEAVKIKSEEIRRIAERHGAKNVRLFGSVARGEAKPESDVNIMTGENYAEYC